MRRPLALLNVPPSRRSVPSSKKARTSSTSRLKYGSLSKKTGVAPRYVTALTVAMKVRVGTITSSPGPTPAIRSATWRAAVPFTQATAWRAPT